MTMHLRWTSAPRIGAAILLALATSGAPLAAQVRTIDPNQAIDSDLRQPQSQSQRRTPNSAPVPSDPAPASDTPRYPDAPGSTEPVDPGPSTPQPGAPAGTNGSAQDVARDGAEVESADSQTFQRQELLRAAEGTFGKGASGLAGILERTLKEQGYPNAYIAGREASAAVVVGLRYGKGEMFHKVEGRQPVYWTGPSVGFDLGGDANKVFVLVYNLYDTADLFKRFPAAEGRVYFVGGFAATYLRRGNTVLIPIRLGVGWRQGVNLGYMKFSRTSKWFPF
ncbi:DUF1134 domain-containing protein [Sphingomonas glacialis]|uniref:DUF1134 domain-containing protein n=1 Tax=Sphingomonas glacialis TaxID=658225 RepID=A0A502FG17_9SPHN|nr:DUF1134 domain-containing protein [Sphingomonas glacialis]TPG48368.1 DUF1134 domain-containing protein [Sphingomonas glacialis]